MSDSVTTSVEVAVSPEVAFDVFTREIDAWYRVDPDTLPDITRTAAIRFEPHLGGRLLDVHDLATKEGRELGRVTVWEPGHRLVFVDNEGSEVDVSFEPVGGGTRVTLTHRGLDRLAPERAGRLRRSGWGALVPFYREHLAPNARPIALAVGSLALFIAISVAAFAIAIASEEPSIWILGGTVSLAAAAVCAVSSIEYRLACRWLPSGWHYRRIQGRVFGLACLGLLLWGLYRILAHGAEPLAAIGVPGVLLMSWLLREQQGPAAGRSLRKQAGRARKSFLQRHPYVRLFLLIAGVIALTLGVSSGLASIDAQLADLLLPVLGAIAAVLWLRALISRRRTQRALGFNPDFYLVVERRVSEEDRRPELLFHEPSKRPEYSGWYAYASDQDLSSPELVPWTMKDLVEQSPEAARPLREGRGVWRWDQARRAYRLVEDAGDQPQPA